MVFEKMSRNLTIAPKNKVTILCVHMDQCLLITLLCLISLLSVLYCAAELLTGVCLFFQYSLVCFLLITCRLLHLFWFCVNSKLETIS